MTVAPPSLKGPDSIRDWLARWINNQFRRGRLSEHRTDGRGRMGASSTPTTARAILGAGETTSPPGPNGLHQEWSGGARWVPRLYLT